MKHNHERVVIDLGPAGVIVQFGRDIVRADTLERARPVIEALEAAEESRPHGGQSSADQIPGLPRT